MLDRDTARAMPGENVKVARQAIAAFNERDVSGFAALTTPDFAWSPSMVAIEGETFLGHEGIETYFGRLNDAWETFHIHRDRFRNSADVAVMLGRLEARGKSSGVELSIDTASILHLRDGRIVRMQGYMDRAAALEAAGLRE